MFCTIKHQVKISWQGFAKKQGSQEQDRRRRKWRATVFVGEGLTTGYLGQPFLLLWFCSRSISCFTGSFKALKWLFCGPNPLLILTLETNWQQNISNLFYWQWREQCSEPYQLQQLSQEIFFITPPPPDFFEAIPDISSSHPYIFQSMSLRKRFSFKSNPKNTLPTSLLPNKITIIFIIINTQSHDLSPVILFFFF